MTILKAKTKKERRQERLERHYKNLEDLGHSIGLNVNGKKMSIALWKLEKECHKFATDYCNGDITTDTWEQVQDNAEKRINELFENKLEGFRVNGDARGYALKISVSETQKLYDKGVNLERDWGGYGILSPDLEWNL